jgi:hypothetical protein
LKVLNITQRVTVNGAARFTAHLELGRGIYFNGGVFGCVGSEFDVLKYLALFAPWSFAVRTPIEMHIILVNVSFESTLMQSKPKGRGATYSCSLPPQFRGVLVHGGHYDGVFPSSRDNCH